MQKPTAFLNTNNGQSKNEIKKVIPFMKLQREYLEISLTQELQNLYSENYKTVLKEVKDQLYKWKDSS